MFPKQHPNLEQIKHKPFPISLESWSIHPLTFSHPFPHPQQNRRTKSYGFTKRFNTELIFLPSENLSTSNNYHTATSPKVKQTRHQRQKRTHKKTTISLSLSLGTISQIEHILFRAKAKDFQYPLPRIYQIASPPLQVIEVVVLSPTLCLFTLIKGLNAISPVSEPGVCISSQPVT